MSAATKKQLKSDLHERLRLFIMFHLDDHIELTPSNAAYSFDAFKFAEELASEVMEFMKDAKVVS